MSDAVGFAAALAIFGALASPGLICVAVAALLIPRLRRMSAWAYAALAFTFEGALCTATVFLISFRPGQRASELWQDPTVIAYRGVPTNDGWAFLADRILLFGGLSSILTVGCVTMWYRMRSNFRWSGP